MARIIRSPRARQDITDVLQYTKERWGEAQARKYAGLIKEALKAIAVDPYCGKPRSTARPSILAYPISQTGKPARHILFTGSPAQAPWRSSGFCTTRWTSTNTFRSLSTMEAPIGGYISRKVVSCERSSPRDAGFQRKGAETLG
jgi:plasmid stabilization system protein ParE